MLRPLGIGEIFDRAITLFVRNFLPFVAISTILLVPIAITRYVSTDMQIHSVASASDPPKSSSRHPSPPADALDARVVVSSLVLIVSMGLMYLAWPIVTNAVAVGVAQQYYGRAVRFRDCYAIALRRWASILGAMLIAGMAIAALYFACALVIVGLLAAAVGVANAAPALSIVLGVMTAITIVALLVTLLVFVIVSAFAAYGASLESLGAVEAFRRAMLRIFNRREFGKALLIGLTVAAAYFGGTILAAAPLLITLVMPAAMIPAVVLESVLEVLVIALMTVLLAVYYFDVRVRREGLDLDVHLQRLIALDVPA